MRAGRLVSMLFILQQHGRMTAAQLAGELEVSIRTVLRDVEALSSAGVPIYAVQGAGGGIELVEGFQTRLTGLTPQEATALLLAGQPDVAAFLGLAADAGAARLKLMAALPPSVAGSATELDTWFLHDPVGPGQPSAETIRLIAHAVLIRVEVRLAGRVSGGEVSGGEVSGGEVSGGGVSGGGDRLRPLALVLAGGRWHVVHQAADGPRVHALDDRVRTCTLGRRFSRPEDFDLLAFWQAEQKKGGRWRP